MLFKESFITDAGAELLARATAQEGRLVWTRTATSERNTDSLSVNEMNALDEEHFGALSMTGAVTNVIVNDARNSVSVHCELSNEEADGTARTFGAWAKIDGDESDVLAIVARCGIGVVPVVINPIEQGVVRAFADFSLNISDKQVQAVGVIIGYYATATALQDEIAAREDLAGRVVTCHVAGQATVGEDQYIYGAKRFQTESSFNGFITTYGKLAFGIYPFTNDINAEIGNESNPFYSATITNATITNIKPLSRNSGSIGSAEVAFDKIYSNTFHANTIRSFGGSTSVGTKQMPFGDSYANIYHGTNIGTDLDRFTDVYSTTFHGDLDGKIPLPSIPVSGTTLTVPIGAIVCVYVEQFVSTGMTYTIGSSDTIYTATLSGRGATLLPAGTYTALSDSDAQGGPCLMIRTL